MALTRKSWKVRYGDGTTKTSLDGLWALQPATDVQVVTEFYEETYQIYKPQPDGTQVLRTENYCKIFHSQDYYWMALDGSLAAGNVSDVPVALPVGSVKTGTLLSDPDWFAIYNIAKEDRTAP